MRRANSAGPGEALLRRARDADALLEGISGSVRRDLSKARARILKDPRGAISRAYDNLFGFPEAQMSRASSQVSEDVLILFGFFFGDILSLTDAAPFLSELAVPCLRRELPKLFSIEELESIGARLGNALFATWFDAARVPATTPLEAGLPVVGAIFQLLTVLPQDQTWSDPWNVAGSDAAFVQYVAQWVEADGSQLLEDMCLFDTTGGLWLGELVMDAFGGGAPVWDMATLDCWTRAHEMEVIQRRLADLVAGRPSQMAAALLQSLASEEARQRLSCRLSIVARLATGQSVKRGRSEWRYPI